MDFLVGLRKSFFFQPSLIFKVLYLLEKDNVQIMRSTTNPDWSFCLTLEAKYKKKKGT